jgi:two-component system, OmpR family, response regulator QseB
MRILLSESDVMSGTSARQALSQSGFAVDWVQDGRAAEMALSGRVYDLLILDHDLPVKDGTSLVASLRAAENWVPALIASARGTVQDRIEGLNAGADDFVRKPFVLGELVARVRAVLRRHAGRGCPVLECGGLRLDPLNRSVTQDGVAVDLSGREFAVLEVLMQCPGRILSRSRIEESVYGWGEEVGSNAVEVHLHYLRKKLGDTAIQNVRGMGYCISDH